MAQALEHSPQIKAEISRCAEVAQHSAGEARYVVYAILNPTQADPFSDYPGLPIYVGETQNVAARIKSHFWQACKANPKKLGRDTYIRKLFIQATVPSVVILQRVDTRFDALEAETRWAQIFLAKGYPLTNEIFVQRQALQADEIERRLEIRKWATPIQNAIDAGLRISASCDWCGRVSVFQPAEFQSYFLPREPISEIRKMASRCQTCGAEYAHTIMRRHEVTVAFTPLNYGDWEH